MRREILKVMLLAATATLPNSAMPAVRKTKIDKRLLGAWVSDKDRTVALWKYRKELTDEQRLRFEAIFGKFKLRYTETHVHTEFDDTKDAIKYSVVASDSSSVVIVWDEGGDSSLQHIHFKKDSYYVVSGHNIEFYKRVA